MAKAVKDGTSKKRDVYNCPHILNSIFVVTDPKHVYTHIVEIMVLFSHW